jgi:flagellar M-ring protein FliF
MAAANLSPISPPSRQLRVIAIVFVVLTAGLVALYFLVLRKEWAVLYNDLRPAEASAIVEQLKKQQVEYKLGAAGADILVPVETVDAVKLSVAAAELPVKGLEGFELFNNSDMGLTDFAQKIKYQRAIQGELARTIMMMEGVAEARVHVSLPERALFRADQGKPKAAVTLVARSAGDETPERIEGVQQLIAAAISDLQVSDVVVLNARGEIISAKPQPPALPDPFAGLRAQLADVLAKVLPGNHFDIAIADLPPAVALAGAPAQAPRSIVIRSAAAISEADQQRATAELRAVKLVAEAGDIVRFETAPPSAAPPASAVAMPAAPLPAAGAPTGAVQAGALPQPSFPIAASIGLGLAAALGLAIPGIVLTRRSRPLLSLEDQRRFADRLRLGLQLEETGASHERA